jgi:protein phosphatase 2C family protein 2/3
MGIGGGAGGFRVAGAGGLANIASILGASGITFKPSDDSDEDEDDEDDLQIIGDESQSDVPESKIKEINQNSYIDDKGLKGDTKPSDVTDKLVSKP